MYSKPRVEYFGDFRELTRTGVEPGDDGCLIVDATTGDVVATPGPNEPFCNGERS